MEKGCICVTGGTGFLASWIIKRLLQDGYSVNTTIRSHAGDTHLYAMLRRASYVHVDDVASAHIHLFEHPNAKGRYICSKTEVPIEELYKLLSTKYPEYKIPSIDFLKSEDAENLMFPSVSSKKNSWALDLSSSMGLKRCLMTQLNVVNETTYCSSMGDPRLRNKACRFDVPNQANRTYWVFVVFEL